MNNLYLLNYHGGECGDFLCLEISKDENFYTNFLVSESDTNRWLGNNPLEEFNLDYRQPSSFVSPKIYQQIDEKFKDRNLIIPSHHARRNLPRSKIINLYVADLKYAPMFLIFLFVKTWMIKHHLLASDTFTTALSRVHMAVTRNKIDYLAADALVHDIEQRRYYYNFEMKACINGYTHFKNLVKDFFPVYVSRLNDIRDSGVYNIRQSVDELLFNPKIHAAPFSKSINMSQSLSVEALEIYHQKNMDLIETIFNKSYDKLVQGNWQQEFQEYIDQRCPGHWFSQNNR